MVTSTCSVIAWNYSGKRVVEVDGFRSHREANDYLNALIANRRDVRSGLVETHRYVNHAFVRA